MPRNLSRRTFSKVKEEACRIVFCFCSHREIVILEVLSTMQNHILQNMAVTVTGLCGVVVGPFSSACTWDNARHAHALDFQLAPSLSHRPVGKKGGRKKRNQLVSNSFPSLSLLDVSVFGLLTHLPPRAYACGCVLYGKGA